MLKVKKIIGKLLSSNMYILAEDNTFDIWIVDIGDFFALQKEIPEGYNIKGLFLTHGHFDHMGGINAFHDAFPEAIIYTSLFGKEQLYSAKKNFSLYHECPVQFNGNDSVIKILKDGDVINIFNEIILNVVETPGHCISCLTYYIDDYIFTGDSYIPGEKVVSKLPKGNKMQAKESQIKIFKIAERRKILAGHNVEKWTKII